MGKKKKPKAVASQPIIQRQSEKQAIYQGGGMPATGTEGGRAPAAAAPGAMPGGFGGLAGGADGIVNAVLGLGQKKTLGG